MARQRVGRGVRHGGNVLPLPVPLLAEERPRRTAAISLERVRQAATRLAPFLRHTPILGTWLTCADGARLKATFKLENQQVTGSFAVRGVLNAALALPPAERARGLIGWGAIDGAAVAYTGHVLGVPTVVHLQEWATTDVVRTLEYWGARVVRSYKTTEEARAAVPRRAEREGLTYVHPYNNPECILGYATIGLEILEFVPDLDVLVTTVGYGGMVAGMAATLKQVKPGVRVVAVDKYPPGDGPVASESLPRGMGHLRVGKILREAAPHTLELVSRHVDDVVLVTEEEVSAAAHFLWTEMEVRTGALGASATAAILTGKVPAHPAEAVCAVISTAGGEGLF